MQSIAHNGLIWLDVENPLREEVTVLARDYSFHPLNLEDCLSKRQLPKIDDHEDHMFILLHFPVYSNQKGLIISSQVSIFLGKNYLVSLHPSELKSISTIFRNFKEDAQQRTTFMNSSPRLLHHIIDVLVDEMFPLLEKVEEELDQIEDKVFDQRLSVALELSQLRRAIADLRRIISPLRRLVADLSVRVQRFASQDLSKYFSDVRDHIEKAWEILDEARETIEIYKDTDYVLSTELTNKVLAILTIVFTLTIPPTVVGALYGMNVPLPGGSETGALTFFGPYTSFLILLVLAIIPAVGMVAYFRRRGWL